MKTADLSGPALDWAVAKCKGPESYASACLVDGELVYLDEASESTWEPSISWNQGGPIIEREEISIKYVVPAMRDSVWQAFPSITAKGTGGRWGVGPTPLIAAMRCYVASKLGDEIEIPEDVK